MPRLSHCRRGRRTSRCFDDACILLGIRCAARCLTSSRIGAAHPAKCAGTDSIFRYGRTCATEKRRTLTLCSTHCRCCLAPQSLAARSHPPRRADGRGYSSTQDCVGRTEEGTRVLATAPADGRGYSSTRDCAGGRKRVLEYSRLRRADGKRRCPTDECFGNIQVPPAGSIEIERRVERLEQRRVGSQANIAKLCDLYKQLATDVRATLPVALPVAFVRSAAAWNGVQCNYGASVPRYSMPCRLSHVSAVGGYRQWLHAWHRPSRLSNDRHGTAACDLAWMTSLRGSAHL
jgi:hypothetical protein